MRKPFQMMLLSISIAFSGAAFAAERGNADEAVAMVKKAVAYFKANGKEKTVAEVNNPKGQFIDRDLYVIVSDFSSTTLANGNNQRMVGKSLIDLRDADGKYFMRERAELLKTTNKGWMDYKWPSPITKVIEHKSTYWEKIDDVTISCGIFK